MNYLATIRNSAQSKAKYIEGHLLQYLIKLGIFEPNAKLIDVTEISRSTDTIFIMGSGSSISDMSSEEWDHVHENGDVLSFNWFFRGEFIPVDYHLMREVGGGGWTHWGRKKRIKEYTDGINNNPCYDNTTLFLFNDGFSLESVVPLYLMNEFENRRICTCATERKFWSEVKKKFVNVFSSSYKLKHNFPSKDIGNLTYGGGTLFEAINISYILGYTNIVLVGVDLYDRRYFFLDYDETRELEKRRNADIDERHNTTQPVLNGLRKWRNYFESEDISLEVYNPYSLLITEDVLEEYDYSNKSIVDPHKR